MIYRFKCFILPVPEVTDKLEEGYMLYSHWNVRDTVISKPYFAIHLILPPVVCGVFFQPGWLVSLLDGCLSGGVCRRKCLGEGWVQEKCIRGCACGGGGGEPLVTISYFWHGCPPVWPGVVRGVCIMHSKHCKNMSKLHTHMHICAQPQCVTLLGGM